MTTGRADHPTPATGEPSERKRVLAEIAKMPVYSWEDQIIDEELSERMPRRTASSSRRSRTRDPSGCLAGCRRHRRLRRRRSVNRGMTSRSAIERCSIISTG
jgi:hypothetical protein